jgi:DNA-binding response OmpR family regulator
MDVERTLTPSASAVLVALPDGERAAEIARALAAERLMPVMAFTRDALLKFAADGRVAAVVVDLALDAEAAGPGPPLLRAVRSATTAPVVVLGFVPGAGADVRTTGADGLLGVDASAADVVGTVVTALTRRRDVPVVTCGDLTVELHNFEAWHGPDRLAVTPTELRLLAALAAARGDVVTKHDLQRAAWGTAGAHDDNRLQAHMRRLRTKLDGQPCDRVCRVRTVRGVGFRLEQLPGVPPSPASRPARGRRAGAAVHEVTGFGAEPSGRRR